MRGRGEGRRERCVLCGDGYRVSGKEGCREGVRVLCERACMREGVVWENRGETLYMHINVCKCVSMPVCTCFSLCRMLLFCSTGFDGLGIPLSVRQKSLT